MSTKIQFALLFLVGLFAGIVVESHILSPHIGPDLATTIALQHSVGFSNNPSEVADVDNDTTVKLQSPPTLAIPPANTENNLPENFIAGIPKISVEEPTYDFGDRDAGDMVEHTFTLKNEGNGTLFIDKVKTNCSCTVAELSAESIPPGGTAKLTLKLNLSRQQGRQNRVALVQSNDPSTPNLKLSLLGNSIYHVKVSPPRVAFEPFEDKIPKSKTFRVVADETVGSFDIVRTRTSGENVKVEVKEIKPGKEFTAKVTVTPQVGVAEFRGWVHLVTDYPGEYGFIGIPVSATFPRPDGSSVETPIQSPPPSPRRYTLLAKVGETLEIKGTSLDGDPVDLVDYEGKTTLVVFWASTCGACRRELTTLKGLYEDYHNKGLEVIGVNLDQSPEKRQQFLQEENVPWLNIGSQGKGKGLSLARRYDVRSIPSISLLDSTGKIVAIDKRGEALREAVSEILKLEKDDGA